jgi:alpha-glucosidase
LEPIHGSDGITTRMIIGSDRYTSLWWRSAVFYEIYVRSFADSTATGVGDLRGIRDHLDHLVTLGVDALWLTPFYPSPMADHGYDVSDPRDVDPMFGTLGAFDDLLVAVHDRRLRLIVDIVPNHFSSAHPWFIEALGAAAGSRARERFIFRDGRGVEGDQPPNNWTSTFGGPAWTRVNDGQWYLHLFAPGQPDLNWRNPEVGDDMERTLRFWLDRGVDGFRIDVAHGLFKDPDLPDTPPGWWPDLMAEDAQPMPMWNRAEVHDVYRRWRTVCDSYPHHPMLVGEVWLGDAIEQAKYVRPDELSLAFNFRLLSSPWNATDIRAAIERSTHALRAVGAPSSWVLSNHDVIRHPTRYGGGETGLRRARAALLLVLALPGPVFLYQGEELGLEEVELPDAVLQDPIWESSGHTLRGRDGCRVPLPWSGDRPPYAFSSGDRTWLPQPEDWASRTVEAESVDPDSMLAFYREALSRRPRTLDPLAQLRWNRTDAVVDVTVSGAPGIRCIVNLSDREIDLPPGELMLTSQPIGEPAADTGSRRLPVDAAAWLAL